MLHVEEALNALLINCLDQKPIKVMHVLEVTRLHSLTGSFEQVIVMSVPYIFHTAMLKNGILCGIMIVKVIITIMRRTYLKIHAF